MWYYWLMILLKSPRRQQQHASCKEQPSGSLCQPPCHCSQSIFWNMIWLSIISCSKWLMIYLDSLIWHECCTVFDFFGCYVDVRRGEKRCRKFETDDHRPWNKNYSRRGREQENFNPSKPEESWWFESWQRESRKTIEGRRERCKWGKQAGRWHHTACKPSISSI